MPATDYRAERPSRLGTTSAASSKPHSPHQPCAPSDSPNPRLPPNKLTMPYGSRKMTAWLRREGHIVNRKRVRRLMRQMGLQVIWQKPNTSKPNPEHKVYRKR